MEDGPRYHVVTVNADDVPRSLKKHLRPGDRVVSVYPTRAEPKTFSEFSVRPGGGVQLEALLELRHPSWAREGIGWTASEAAAL